MEEGEGQTADWGKQEMMNLGPWRELGEKKQKAMEASLKVAEDYMMEIMTLLKESEPICAIEKELERIKSNTRVNQHYARMIKGSPKTVVEIFNPKRFAPHCRRSGLIASAAFDLELGDELLDPRERDRVMKFIKEFRPGLTVISPPCTLFSIMQNMNVMKKDFHRRLREARILLNFACEIILMIRVWRRFPIGTTPHFKGMDRKSSSKDPST